MTIKTNFSIILLLLSLTTVVIFFTVQNRAIRKKSQRVINLTTFQTSIGWGYRVDINNETRIYQPFIPVIETNSGFETKLIAENAGRIVVNKLISNKQPVLTLKDLQLAGVNIDKMTLKKVNSLD